MVRLSREDDVTRLNVIDLDHTLLRFDSLRRLLLQQMNVDLLWLVACRGARVIGRAAFAARVHDALRQLLTDRSWVESFARSLCAELDQRALAHARAHMSPGDLTLIVSSAPEEYVSVLARELGYVGLGSRLTSAGRPYFHCFGPNKLLLLQERYPPERHEYHFAMSDSRSDIPLLALFAVGHLWDSRSGAVTQQFQRNAPMSGGGNPAR
jgi:phosphoserine phosphatase